MTSITASYPAGWSIALLLLRIASGLAFLYHGSAISFGAFGGPGPQGFAAYTHLPLLVVYLVGLAQVGGGLAILLGFPFRFGAICVAIVMVGAIVTVHLPHGWDISKGGMEYAFTQLCIAIAFLFTGPGMYSVHPVLPESLRKI